MEVEDPKLIEIYEYLLEMAPEAGKPKNEKLVLNNSKVFKIKKDLYKKII